MTIKHSALILMLNAILFLSVAMWWTDYSNMEKAVVSISGFISVILFIMHNSEEL